MSLLIDNRDSLSEKPGLHVFITGVSDYQYLPDDEMQESSGRSFGMCKLSCTALSAFKIFKWITDPNRKFPVGLATVRLLLSPTEAEINTIPAISDICDRCSLENFCNDFRAFRSDAASHQTNHTFFYYAGHGIQRSKSDSVLLLDDFDNPGQAILYHSIDMSHLLELMRPTKPNDSAYCNMARTQTFFVDACRNYPDHIKNFHNTHPSQIDDEVDLDLDNRNLTVFHSALSGGRAKEIIGKQTIFCSLLIHCLDIAGVGSINEKTDGTTEWGVSTDSLNLGLKRSFEALKTRVPDLIGEQDCDLGKMAAGVIIHRLDNPPIIPFELEITPPEAVTCFQLQVRDYTGNLKLDLKAPVIPYPYRDQLPAGRYRFNLNFNPPHPSYISKERNLELLPPLKKWVIPVEP
jgi:hypothetical protein